MDKPIGYEISIQINNNKIIKSYQEQKAKFIVAKESALQYIDRYNAALETLEKENDSLKTSLITFLKGKNKEIKARKGTLEDAIVQNMKLLSDCKGTLNKIEQNIEEIDRRIASFENRKIFTGDGIKFDGDVVTITDQKIESNVPLTDEEVIVHCTNFFPKNKTILNNYDGNKYVKTTASYDGVCKEVDVLSHRHSVHFARNGVVESTGDGYGTWEQPKYIIIEPFEPHKNQFVGLGYNDSWTHGSVKFEGKPIMLVREDAYNEIPLEEHNNYTIMKYNGNYVECARNALKTLGIKEHYLDPNGPEHSNSYDMAVEKNLDTRNVAINYIKDNVWNGKDKIVLNEEELHDLYEVTKELKNISGHEYGKYKLVSKLDEEIWLKNYNRRLVDDVSKETNMDENFVSFLISYGIEKCDNGYTFKSDEELYQVLNQMLEAVKNGISIPEFFHIDDFIETYNNYLNRDIKENIVDTNLTCQELYKFKNHASAKAFASISRPIEYARFALTEQGCHLDFYVQDGDEWKKTQKYIVANNAKELNDSINNYLETLKETLDNNKHI